MKLLDTTGAGGKLISSSSLIIRLGKKNPTKLAPSCSSGIVYKKSGFSATFPPSLIYSTLSSGSGSTGVGVEVNLGLVEFLNSESDGQFKRPRHF